MKSLLLLTKCVYEDVCALAGAAPQKRDLSTVAARLKTEGLSFLSIGLPTFEAAFTRGLELGYISSDTFPGFKKSRRRSPVPAFLQVLVRMVFSETGELLPDANATAVWAVRQFCLFYKKVKLDCSLERTERAMAKFVATDDGLPRLRDIDRVKLTQLSRIFARLYGTILSTVNQDILEHNLKPKHGSGAVAEGLKASNKYVKMPWYEVVEPLFPMDAYFAPSMEYDDVLSENEVRLRGSESPAVLVAVPKTQKSPRLIAKEPCCLQYLQQALWGRLRELLENGAFPGYLNRRASHNVQFTLQSRNQNLALEGSKNGTHATIDLSEASDRLPACLVSHLVRPFPILREALFRTRSGKVAIKFPHSKSEMTKSLRKFATSGSALCFPIETMVFYAIGVSSLVSCGVPFAKAKELVLSYGDDIVCPTIYASTVMDNLEAFGLKVNRDKSFVTGRFRESCGTDAFDGVNVTPVYVREHVTDHGIPKTTALSLVATSNMMHAAGLWRSADFLARYTVRKCRVRLPLVRENSPGLGLISHFRDGYSADRWVPELQRWETRMSTFIPKKDVRDLSEERSLLRYWLEGADTDGTVVADMLLPLPSTDPAMLVRVKPGTLADEKKRDVRPHTLKLKCAWLPAY
jgi:hypothetical protein